MNKITKRMPKLILVFTMLISLLPQNILIASAATNAIVYVYSPMVEAGGNIYYVQTVEGKENVYDIYKLEVATGNKTKLISSKNSILNLMLHDDILYYTSYEMKKGGYQTYSVSSDAKVKKTVCTGYFISLDDSSIYYTVSTEDKSKLYKRDYGSKKDTLIYTGNMTFSYVKSLDNILYFTQFNKASSKVVLFALAQGQTKLSVLTTDKITLNETERTDPAVSDVVKINGNIYYQYGTHQGSGSYWYGTLKKIDPQAKKKTVIVEDLYEEQIFHNDINIFYSGIESSETYYKYNTETGETSTYVYKTTGTESFNILGDKTYCAKADGKASVTVSRFTSGTNKQGYTKDFIDISYKQKKGFDYSAGVKKLGDYLLIPVTCMDYNDASYGWRGRCVGVAWYVADAGGKILAQFK